MTAIAGALVAITILFFAFGGAETIENIFKSKTEAARERRLEAEARVEEARLKSHLTLDKLGDNTRRPEPRPKTGFLHPRYFPHIEVHHPYNLSSRHSPRSCDTTSVKLIHHPPTSSLHAAT